MTSAAPSEIDQLALQVQIAELEARIYAREEFRGFIRYVNRDYEEAWFHRELIAKLQWWIDTPGARLLIAMPPRHGKSELVSRLLLVYLLGTQPDRQFILGTYSQDLARRMSRDVKKYIKHEYYREVFPDIRLASAFSDQSSTVDQWEIDERSGGMRAVGVGGGLTGMGGDYIVIDDPIKNREEADSPTIRKKVWDWFTDVVDTRLETGGRLLVTQTRWHSDDLIGRLEEKMREGGEHFERIVFPAIKEDEPNEADPREIGEPLWPDRYPLKRLETIRLRSPSTFLALFQQRPTSPGGNIFKRDWLQQHFTAPPSDLDEVITSWDFTFKNTDDADFVVGQAWGRKGSHLYLLDQVRDRMSFTQTLAAMQSFCSKWSSATAHLVEEKANGSAIIDTLKGKIGLLVAINPTESKEARAQAASTSFEAGDVFTPDPTTYWWVHDWREEMADFPRAKNDDQVDATTQAVIRLRESGGRCWWLDLLG